MKTRDLMANVLIIVCFTIIAVLTLPREEQKVIKAADEDYTERVTETVTLTVTSSASSKEEEQEIEEITEPEKEVDEKEVELLARLIYAECGATYCTTEMRELTGAVVINRINSKYFPGTLEEVVYQKGQYECVMNGSINMEPSEECVEIAKDLLINGTDIPEEVIYQAEFKQGSGTYKHIQNMYYCYR